MAPTQDSKRYTEIPRILQFLPQIHQSILRTSLSTLWLNKERHAFLVDWATWPSFYRPTGCANLITSPPTARLWQTVYCLHRCKWLCYKHNPWTRRRIRPLTPSGILFKVLTTCWMQLRDPQQRTACHHSRATTLSPLSTRKWAHHKDLFGPCKSPVFHHQADFDTMPSVKVLRP